MGIEDDIFEIKQLLIAIEMKLEKPIDQKAPEEISEEKDTKKSKQEVSADEPILYECTNCGVSFSRGEQHVCKTK